jgi:hypothetical protein
LRPIAESMIGRKPLRLMMPPITVSRRMFAAVKSAESVTVAWPTRFGHPSARVSQGAGWRFKAVRARSRMGSMTS